jgi:hypothetical protein
MDFASILGRIRLEVRAPRDGCARDRGLTGRRGVQGPKGRDHSRPFSLTGIPHFLAENATRTNFYNLWRDEDIILFL